MMFTQLIPAGTGALARPAAVATDAVTGTSEALGDVTRVLRPGGRSAGLRPGTGSGYRCALPVGIGTAAVVPATNSPIAVHEPAQVAVSGPAGRGRAGATAARGQRQLSVVIGEPQWFGGRGSSQGSGSGTGRTLLIDKFMFPPGDPRPRPDDRR